MLISSFSTKDLVDAISQLPGHARIFRLYDQIGPDKDRVPALTANPLALFLVCIQLPRHFFTLAL